jgi:anhydro-N-acetylmuramic acid kinase
MDVPVQLVEALAFAWLAQAHELRKPAGLPTVTGARHRSVLGCRYPA